jgi:hypothetical protein
MFWSGRRLYEELMKVSSDECEEMIWILSEGRLGALIQIQVIGILSSSISGPTKE